MNRLIYIIISLSLMLMLVSCGSQPITNNPSYDSAITTVILNNPIVVENVVNLPINQAVQNLRNCGATNITSNIDKLDKWSKDKIIVVSQSVDAGQSVEANQNIYLHCKRICMLSLELTSDFNLIFDKYDMDIYLDDTYIGSIANGKTLTYLADDLVEGNHVVTAYKSGDKNLAFKRDIELNGNILFTSTIHHGSKEIEFRDISTENGILGKPTTMLYVEGMSLTNALTSLREIGFANIYEEPYSEIWSTDDWIVSHQNIDSGKTIDTNEVIQLDCINESDYFNEVFPGKNAKEIIALAENGGYNIVFENEDEKNIDDLIYQLDDKAKEKAICSSVIQSDNNTITLIFDYDENKSVSTEPENIIDQNQESDDNVDKSKSTIPIMSGITLKDVVNEMESCGLNEIDDYDFGHGTRNKSMSDASGGLTADIIYVQETQEIMCVDIVTFNYLSTSDQQNKFVTIIAGHICPKNNSDEVSSWVKSNVGTKAQTEINGFTYILDLGNNGNILYSAGEPEWENWELSQTEDTVQNEITKASTKKKQNVSFSTNDKETAKEGNSGIYSYVMRGKNYDIYYIIDFDNGYVYRFLDGNDDEGCDRTKIDSGDLNSVVITTYHDGNDTWQNGLHFKWKRMTDILVLEDHNHFEYEFTTVNLESAYKILETKTIYDY